MFAVRVRTISPAGVQQDSHKTYYEVSDALTVAEIERRNALIPTGREEDPTHFGADFRTSYKVTGRHGESVEVSIINESTGEYVTLRDPVFED